LTYSSGRVTFALSPQSDKDLALSRKVLLADDSVTAQNMGRRILVDAGYEVITVNNGSSALKKINESKPDLIVVDVYMPGYSGLEVCQRIRESQETARIPVLLTVGKLEPFKADEARRVRADAFIVKPFEASELLTALAKLEDKIVPQPSGRRSGRQTFVDEQAGASKEFGDVESGWKNRLKIPPPHHPRTHEPAPKADSEAADVKASEERVAFETEPQVAPKMVNEAIRAESSETVSQEAERADTEPKAPEFLADQAAAEMTSAVTESSVGESFATAGTGNETESSNLASRAQESIQPAAEAGVKDDHKSHEEEVAAALASLAPTNGDHALWSASDATAVTMAAAAGREYSGPRWIAEEVALTDDESSLILDQEMQKAFAALAAADAARMSSSRSGDKFAAEISSGQAGSSVMTESQPAENTYASSGNVEQREELHSAVVSGAPVPESQVEVSQPQVVFAAAASAGVGASTAEVSTQAVEQSEVAPVTTPQPEARDSDLASAWASWKQVRDSVSAPEFTAQIADAAATGFKEIRHEEPAANVEPETDQPEESNAIASIVDSVLAELKPKLMEEIAKKMRKEK
jgi:twitching motility two-component system response regulator PilH